MGRRRERPPVERGPHASRGGSAPDPDRPPRLAEVFLLRRLPAELRESVSGDLEEEYRERRGQGSGLGARLWYWGQVLSLRPGELARRLDPVARDWSAPGDTPVVRSWNGNLMESIVQTLRYALRRLARSPGFTTVAVLSLALGIGANTAVFTLVNAILLRDPGIGEPERVVQLFRVVGGSSYFAFTWDDYRHMRDELRDVLANVTAVRPMPVRVGESDEVYTAGLVSGDYFGAMGISPLMGRGFRPGEETDLADAPAVAVVSHDFWVRVLGGDPAAVGQEIRVNARPHTLIGVLPPDFTPKAQGVPADVLLPDGGAVANPGADNLFGTARLLPGVTVEQTRAAFGALAARLNEGRPASLTPMAFTVVPQTEVSFYPGADGPLASMAALLFVVVGLVLLIACTNLASFLLARTTDRRKEIAVRLALGASKARVTAQLLVEALILALLGGAGGVLLAYAGLRALLSVNIPLPVAIRLDVAPDLRVLGFTLTAVALATLLFGLLPALGAGKAEVASTLRDESGGHTGSRGRLNLRSGLVMAQVAMSMVLLLAAGLFLRSLLAQLRVDPGFEPRGVAVVDVEPETTGYDEEQGRALYEELLQEVRDLPGVRQAALGTRIPLQIGNWRAGVRPPEMELPEGRSWLNPQAVYVSPGYFETLSIEVLRGREFTSEDIRDGVPAVILNESAAEQYWGPGVDPVGRTLLVANAGGAEGRVVGLVKNAKLKTVGEVTEPVAYFPLTQQYQGAVVLAARGSGSEAALAAELRRVAKSLDPDLYVHGAMSAQDASGLAFYLPRMGALVLGLFGGLGLLMASIGLYGVVSYTVARRKKEVGIRLSLGADGKEVVRMMMGGGLRLVAAGVVVGLVAAFAAGPLLQRFLFGVRGLDPVAFALVPLLLLGVASLAAWLPARRAARVSPMETLRSE